MQPEWDETDKRILSLLQVNARLSAREIADKIGLTVTPTYERMRKIERSGIVLAQVALLDRNQLNKKTIAFCNVSLQVHSIKAIEGFERAVKKIPEVMECYHITGNYDYLLKVAVADMNEYQHFLTRRLAVIEHVAQVHSNFVMTDVKYSTAYTIDK
ncbi:MAG: Lrp/AsnC family transcriptional regulator [Sphingobacteriales bacterium]|nr:MAG: Lrp/AsnC family transcriptional regulator [Sphingobacteriales bacterium]